MVPRRIRVGLVAILLALACAPAGAQQQPTMPEDESGKSKMAEQLNKILGDPTEMEKLEKERNRPPLEIFKSLVMPNDVLPYVKANQWSTMALELRSNQVNYAGLLETVPIPLRGMPHEVVFRRDAGLVKGQRSTLRFQVMTPTVPKELLLRLLRPDSLRDDETFPATLRVLEPHQMLIPVLTKGPNDAYGRWNQLRAFFPLSGAKGDQSVYDKQRYYRMVLPADVDRPLLPSHPLAWTAISHVIWDGMPPETLSISQQEALLDWLHWGGQLVIVGGAGPNFAPLRESFLGPYLPGEPTGRSAQLNVDDLKAFAAAYPPGAPPVEPDDPIEGTQSYVSAFEQNGRRYKDPTPIAVLKGKEVYLAGLAAKPGARTIGLGKEGLPPLGVEWRVGRGRVLMVGLSIVDPALIAWPGYDTMIRRVVLRRPEETLGEVLRYSPGGGYLPPRYDFLTAPDLTAVRIFGRDLGAPTRRVAYEDDDGSTTGSTSTLVSPLPKAGPRSPTAADMATYYNPWQVPVAEWLDDASLPKLSREALERASGIEVPKRSFVLTVILSYLIALVPVTWLLGRYLLRRVEWAWVGVVLMAVGFALVVVRAKSFNVGYSSRCNEIDLIETYGDHPRGHLSRFASIYTDDRIRYSISYDEPTALALPMSTGRSIRGEDVQRSVFEATATPTLSEFQVQPFSLSMFRAEQFMNLPGGIRLVQDGPDRKVVNGTEAELLDAVIVEIGRGGSRAIPLGRIGPKLDVGVPAGTIPAEDFRAAGVPDLKKNEVDPAPFLNHLVHSSYSERPEDAGEVRLLAWVAKPQARQTIEPAVDVHQGFTLVLAHLTMGTTPDPASDRYDALARGPEQPTEAMLNTPPPPQPVPGRPRNFQPPPPTGPVRRAPEPPGALPTGPRIKAAPAGAMKKSTPSTAPDGSSDDDEDAAAAPEKPRR